MKQLLLFLISISGSLTWGQIQFEQTLPPPPQLANHFEVVSFGTVTSSDINGDGFQDVLITGQNATLQKIAKLYINDGLGNCYEQLGIELDGVRYSSTAIADVDGDGDQDVMITGQNTSNQIISKLYTNDGFGNFTEVIGSPFDGVSYGSIAFSDIDGDGDQDLLITGQNTSNQRIAKLYVNDGTGNFTEVAGTTFDGVWYGSIAFSDIDGNGSNDLLLTGQNNANQRIAKLYSNDGAGGFTEVIGTPFDGVGASAITLDDIDADGDQDAIITGQNNSNQRIAKLYTNDGTGNFTEIVGVPFDGVWYGAIAFSDVDGNGGKDLLITGQNNANLRIAKLYSNNGLGEFTEVIGSAFDGVWNAAIAFEDLDNDGDEDVLITGQNTSNLIITKPYVNNGLGDFIESVGTPFDLVSNGSVAFSDIDADGDQDVIITGQNGTNPKIAKLYFNDGFGSFAEVLGTPFSGVSASASAFADVDGDGDHDLFITGNDNSGTHISKLYKNDGTGIFTEVTSSSFIGVQSGAIDFSDVDGDGSQDILITGISNSNTRVSKLYINDGTGNFTESLGTPFDGLSSSSVAFADVDGDGDQDVLITGHNDLFERITKLYVNDGTGTFTEEFGTSFVNVSYSSVAFSDIDLDGDLDLFITGQFSATDRIAKLYRNDGFGDFTEVIGTTFDPILWGDVAFGDIDGDGSQDLFISGENQSSNKISKLYINDGLGNFVEETGMPFDGVSQGSIILFDINASNKLDVLITGINSSNQHISKLYENTTCLPTSSSIDSIISCDTYTWIDGVTYSESNNSAIFTLSNAAGCDSIIALDLTINNSFEAVDTVSSCGNYTWMVDGNIYTQTGVYSASFVNQSGCDSIHILNLTINLFEEVENVTSCSSSYFWDVDGNTYLQSGSYSASFVNQTGCDSLHILNLVLDCSLYANVSVTNNIGANCDGEAEANVYGGTPPYSYLFSNGETTPNIQNLCSGVYLLDVSDDDMNSYQTAFVISDETIDYNNDPVYQDYLDSLFSSAVNDCDFDYTQPADSFYVDQNSILQLDSNLYEITWYLYQNQDTFIFTNVYYTTEDINGSFAFVLTIYCEDEARAVLESVNFIYKTGNTLSVEIHEKEKIKLYPNPSLGLFTLKSELLGKKYTIFDSQGRSVKSGVIENKTTIINLETEKAGVYFLKTEEKTLKIILQ